MGLRFNMIETEQGHYPYQAPIDAYGNSGFRFAEMSHKGSLLCLPSGMHAWPVSSPAELSLSCFSKILDEKQIDVLFLGVGHDIVALPSEIRQAFRDANITIEVVSTGSAIRTYNVLLNENRSIGAALIAVESAR